MQTQAMLKLSEVARTLILLICATCMTSCIGCESVPPLLTSVTHLEILDKDEKALAGLQVWVTQIKTGDQIPTTSDETPASPSDDQGKLKIPTSYFRFSNGPFDGDLLLRIQLPDGEELIQIANRTGEVQNGERVLVRILSDRSELNQCGTPEAIIGSQPARIIIGCYVGTILLCGKSASPVEAFESTGNFVFLEDWIIGQTPEGLIAAGTQNFTCGHVDGSDDSGNRFHIELYTLDSLDNSQVSIVEYEFCTNENGEVANCT